MGETNQEGPAPTGHRPGRRTSSVPGSAVLTPPSGLPVVGAPTPSVPAQRTSPETPAPGPVRDTPPAPPAPPLRVCSCGHPEEMHEHYRPGDDCGACGPRGCGSFRDRDAPGPLRRLFRRT